MYFLHLGEKDSEAWEPSCTENDLNGFGIAKMGLEVSQGIEMDFIKLNC